MKEEGKKRRKKELKPKIRGNEEPKKKGRTNWLNTGEEKKGKKKKSKGVADLTSGFFFVCLITKMSLKTELWKLKSAKMYFQFP